MEDYKLYIKKRVLMAAGITLEDYENIEAPVNQYGYDKVDEIVINAAIGLPNAYVDLFALLYKCRDKDQAHKRIRRIKKGKCKNDTFNRYISESRNKVVKLVVKSPLKINEIKKIIGC